VLIAQFSRNFNESSKSISGDDLMDITLNKIRDTLHSTSGKANPILSFCGSCKKKSTHKRVDYVVASPLALANFSELGFMHMDSRPQAKGAALTLPSVR